MNRIALRITSLSLLVIAHLLVQLTILFGGSDEIEAMVHTPWHGSPAVPVETLAFERKIPIDKSGEFLMLLDVQGGTGLVVPILAGRVEGDEQLGERTDPAVSPNISKTWPQSKRPYKTQRVTRELIFVALLQQLSRPVEHAGKGGVEDLGGHKGDGEASLVTIQMGSSLPAKEKCGLIREEGSANRFGELNEGPVKAASEDEGEAAFWKVLPGNRLRKNKLRNGAAINFSLSHSSTSSPGRISRVLFF